jgi:penicillin-binding protein 1B
VALGSYEVTPLEAVGAYTLFANQGRYVKPNFLRLVRSSEGKQIYRNKVEQRPALDPRVAYMMTNLMEEVLRSGTAAGVRARYNIDFPAAGKTGTSHDGWFAGFTSELLCVVWVGFDDNRELNLEGAHSAAPIWAEFIKSAMQYREYRDVKPFPAADGVVSMDIDPQSGMAATPSCPTHRTEVYIAGTQPVGICPVHGGGRMVTSVAGWEVGQPAAAAPPSDTAPRITGSGSDGLQPGQPAAAARRAARQDASTPAPATPTAAQTADPKKPQEKKGIFRRLIGVFK